MAVYFPRGQKAFVDTRAKVLAGYEGLVAKLRTGTYQPGQRSDGWRKHPLIRTTKVIVCGFHPARAASPAGWVGSRSALTTRTPATWCISATSGPGSGRRPRSSASPTRTPGATDASVPGRAAPRGRPRVRWVEPELVGEVVFRTFTSAGRVRHTGWRGLRDDRKPDEVVAPGVVPAPASAGRPTPTATVAVERPAAAGPEPTPLGGQGDSSGRKPAAHDLQPHQGPLPAVAGHLSMLKVRCWAVRTESIWIERHQFSRSLFKN